jgi:hypothetical protein
MEASPIVNDLIGRYIKRIDGPGFDTCISSFCHSNNRMYALACVWGHLVIPLRRKKGEALQDIGMQDSAVGVWFLGTI